MVKTVSIGVLCGAAFLAGGAAHAQAARGAASHQSRLQAVTFRLQVRGEAGSTSTFWVAHGPLGGRFGITQLLPQGNNTFAASVRLPASAKTTFAYLQGTGTKMTRMGPVPGNPVVTISTTDWMTAAAATRHVVHWYAPQG